MRAADAARGEAAAVAARGEVELAEARRTAAAEAAALHSECGRLQVSVQAAEASAATGQRRAEEAAAEAGAGTAERSGLQRQAKEAAALEAAALAALSAREAQVRALSGGMRGMFDALGESFLFDGAADGVDPADEVAAALPLEGVASAAGATSAALGEVSTVAREWIALWGGKIVEVVSPASNRGRGW